MKPWHQSLNPTNPFRVTHQTTLLPLLPTLQPARHTPKPAYTSLSPIELLTELANKLDIETYLEDSQFGLLKTSLALAGKRFVVDVDVEVDSPGPEVGGEDEDEGEVGGVGGGGGLVSHGDDGAAAAARGAGGDQLDGDGRGRVRLSKLTANHVTPSGGTGKSEWIASVLRGLVEAYLQEWNGDREEGKLAEVAGRLAQELEELKGLDGMCHGGGAEVDGTGTGSGDRTDQVGRNCFGELEVEVGVVQSWSRQ